MHPKVALPEPGALRAVRGRARTALRLRLVALKVRRQRHCSHSDVRVRMTHYVVVLNRLLSGFSQSAALCLGCKLCR
eukprot:362104-Chlamydomonas_euryale.AAC.7